MKSKKQLYGVDSFIQINMYRSSLKTLVEFHSKTFESVDEREGEQNVVDCHFGFRLEHAVGTLFVDWDVGFHLGGVKGLFLGDDWSVETVYDMM